jgi:hypothetical protein
MANKTQHKIELTALDKTKKAFNSVKKGLSGIKSGAMGVTKVLGASALAFTGAAATLSLLAKQSFDFADAIGKVATRTGMATDTVQAFQIAAVESGSSVEIANKSLEKFTRSVGDAQRGLKTQVDIFKDLGVEIEDTNGNTKSMDVLLREVADGMAGLSSQSEKATVSANIFGRAGIQIIDVLDNGGAAFDTFIQKAREYGLILSEDGIRQSEKFNDTLSFLNRQFQTIKAAVSIAFLPVLQDLATRLKEATKSTVGAEGSVMLFGDAIRDVVLTRVDGFIRGFADFLDVVHNIRRELLVFTVGIETAFLQTELSTLKFRRSMDLLGLQTETFNTLISTAETKLELAEGKITLFDASTKSAGDGVRKFADNLKTYFIDVLGKSDEEANNLLDSYNKLFGGEERELTNLTKPLEAFKSQFLDINNLIENSTVKAIKGMEDAILDFVMTGKSSFKDLVNSIIADLIRIQIRKSLEGSFDFISSAFGSLFGKRAMGGSVAAGQPYLVGEKGAELFVPNQSGNIVPNNQMAATGGTNINFTIQATDTSGFDQLLTSRKNQIVAMISQAMNQRGKTGLI